MDQAIVAAVRAHAAREAPRECCGLVTVERGRRRYRPCRNLAEGAGHFLLDPADWAAAEDAGEIVAVAHSHPFASPVPSQADLAMCETTGLPWLIVNHPLGHAAEVKPSGWRAPLVGREFSHGVLDCYTLIRDYYREIGIALPDFERPDDWWSKGQDLYRTHFGEAGFRVVETSALRPRDVLLFRVASPVPNHAAIYLGNNVMLHHLQGRLSSRDVLGGWWFKAMTHVLRHEALA